MRSLLVVPAKGILLTIAVVAALIAVAGWLWMWPAERDIEARGYGIVSLQLAFTPQRAEAILQAWGPDGQSSARAGMLRDFLFMAGYGLAFASVTLWVARAQSGLLQQAGLTLTLMPLAAVLLDALENILFLGVLGIMPPPPVPILAASLSASIKFLLLALTILYWVAGGVARLAKRASREG